MNEARTATADEGVSADIRRLLEPAEAGDETALPALRELFDSRPDLWMALSDLSGRAERTLLRAAAGDNLLAQEALSRRLTVIKSELTSATASPQERLLADWVALTWLHVHLADLDAAASRHDGQPDGPRAREAQRRLDRAHRRYLTAHRQLALLTRAGRALPPACDAATRPIN